MFKKVTSPPAAVASALMQAAASTGDLFTKSKASFTEFFAKKAEPLSSLINPEKEVYFNTKANMVREEAKELILSNWTTWSREQFELRLAAVLNYVGNDSSVENVVHSSSVALWLLLNVHLCKHEEENLLWTNFPSMLADYDKTIAPDKAPSKDALDAMKAALELAFVDISKEQMKEQVSQIVESGETPSAEKYVARARELEPGFLAKLRQLDSRAISNVKSADRAIEKANADYSGDTSRVLDYLRSIVHVHVDVGDTAEKILQRYNRAKNGLPGTIRRLKAFGDVNELPRVLLNIEYEGIIGEVQIHFRFRGFDADYQRKKHLVYELIRKPTRRINEKDHVVDLLLDLCEHCGLHVTREDLLGDIQDVSYETFDSKDEDNSGDSGSDSAENNVTLKLVITKRKQTIEQLYKVKEIDAQDGSLLGFKLQFQK
eukprot:TRINITY_DN4281_c0_g1_i1.p1 TRINITY_DN4281_c0_g1~~TRINITY_DN4281_c0_g1_i1.p1  ORF type:complete len:432 (-),score=136.07 TRINITY_DN4281_c0_g1_i1:215-1510(-)